MFEKNFCVFFFAAPSSPQLLLNDLPEIIRPSGIKDEFSQRQMRTLFLSTFNTVSLLEQVKHGDRKDKPHHEICPNTLSEMFKFADLRQQREWRFDQHQVVLLAAPPKSADFPADFLFAESPYLPKETFARKLFPPMAGILDRKQSPF